jgi:hypothetical protein
MEYLITGPTKCFILLRWLQGYFLLRFFGPSGLPISPNLRRWWALEVPEYVYSPTALNLRQTRQTVAPGTRFSLTLRDNQGYKNKFFDFFLEGVWRRV